VRQLPGPSLLEVVSDFTSFWKAFPPSEDWLRRWRQDAFRKKPEHDAESWKALSDSAQERQIDIRSIRCGTLSDRDYGLLQGLKTELQERLNSPEDDSDEDNPTY
jgi:hypothetical protein